jgi:hypothetical protein
MSPKPVIDGTKVYDTVSACNPRINGNGLRPVYDAGTMSWYLRSTPRDSIVRSVVPGAIGAWEQPADAVDAGVDDATEELVVDDPAARRDPCELDEQPVANATSSNNDSETGPRRIAYDASVKLTTPPGPPPPNNVKP